MGDASILRAGLTVMFLLHLLMFSQLETEENSSLRIMDALAGHLHQIQVKAQDALNNYSQWSEWSHVIEARPWTGE